MEIIKISKEEKIIRIKNKYKDNTKIVCVHVLDLYRKELDDLWQKDREKWYRRFVDICAEHELDFSIACSAGGPC